MSWELAGNPGLSLSESLAVARFRALEPPLSQGTQLGQALSLGGGRVAGMCGQVLGHSCLLVTGPGLSMCRRPRPITVSPVGWISEVGVGL